MFDSKVDEQRMRLALQQALRAEELDEVPIGAVLVCNESGEVLSQSHNRPISQNDPTAHAEINVIREASTRRNNYRLPKTTLYTTLEPCPMCAGAIIHSRIERVVIATQEPRSGAAGSVLNILQNQNLNHQCTVEFGLLKIESAQLLTNFFRSRR